MFTIWMALIVSVFLLLIDQISKLVISAFFTQGDSFSLIKGLLNFQYTHNHGAAFGMFQGWRWYFIIISSSVISLAIVWLLTTKIKSKLCIWAVALIISGGIGNLIDRLFNYGGYVVDFLIFDFGWFPYIFNFADICVVVGGTMFMGYLVSDIIHEAKKGKETEMIIGESIKDSSEAEN